ISYKDFSSADHYYQMVNDVAAAKRYLDRKNDSGECNTSNLILIGAESGAALGALWLDWAWKNPKLKLGAFGMAQPTRQNEGQDVACAVWLSITPSVGGTTKANVANWIRGPGREKKVPMAFLYGEKDTKAAAFAKSLHEGTLRAHTDKAL